MKSHNKKEKSKNKKCEDKLSIFYGYDCDFEDILIFLFLFIIGGVFVSVEDGDDKDEWI